MKAKLLISVLTLSLSVAGFGCRSQSTVDWGEDLPFYNQQIQLHPPHLRTVVDVIHKTPRCKLLVWGTGHDSRLWCEVNRAGYPVFIEDTPTWAKLAQEQSHIFVDDYIRVVERQYSAAFLRPRFGSPEIYPERDFFAHFAKKKR